MDNSTTQQSVGEVSLRESDELSGEGSVIESFFSNLCANIRAYSHFDNADDISLLPEGVKRSKMDDPAATSFHSYSERKSTSGLEDSQKNSHSDVAPQQRQNLAYRIKVQGIPSDHLLHDYFHVSLIKRESASSSPPEGTTISEFVWHCPAEKWLTTQKSIADFLRINATAVVPSSSFSDDQIECMARMIADIRISSEKSEAYVKSKTELKTDLKRESI